MNLKILHITTSIQGGAGIATLRLHKALIKNGVSSSVLSVEGSNNIINSYKYDGVIEKSLLQPQYPQLSFKNYLNERLFHQYEKSYQLYKNKLEEEKLLTKKIETDCLNNKIEIFTSPHSNYDITTTSAYKEADIIHLHWVAGFLDYHSFFTKNNKPIVWTLHDENPLRGGFHYEEDELSNKVEYTNIDSQYKKIKSESIKGSQKLAIVSPSKWLANRAKNSEVFSKYNVVNIYNTLDTVLFSPKIQSFCREYLSLPKDQIIFLFAAQHIKNYRKGFDILESILMDNQLNDVHFLVLGNSNTHIDNNRFHFIGSIHDELFLPLIYSAVDAFILPSREDNLPNTMLESLCCGTPVISFAVGGMKEEIETGINGILCGDLSKENLKQGILDFINGRYSFDKQKISENAHLKYSEAKISSKYVDVYNQIVK